MSALRVHMQAGTGTFCGNGHEGSPRTRQIEEVTCQTCLGRPLKMLRLGDFAPEGTMAVALDRYDERRAAEEARLARFWRDEDARRAAFKAEALGE